jgi:hypothetical protein
MENPLLIGDGRYHFDGEVMQEGQGRRRIFYSAPPTPTGFSTEFDPRSTPLSA